MPHIAKAETARRRADERPRVGPAFPVAGRVLEEQDQTDCRGDRAADDDPALLAHKEAEQQDADSGQDDDERPANLAELEVQQLRGEQHKADEDQDGADGQRGRPGLVRARLGRARIRHASSISVA